MESEPICELCGREVDGGYTVHREVFGKFQEIELACGCSFEIEALDQELEDAALSRGEDLYLSGIYR